MSWCATKERCALKKIPPGTHTCPKCNKHVHKICGIPNPKTTGIQDSTICFACHDTTTEVMPDINSNHNENPTDISTTADKNESTTISNNNNITEANNENTRSITITSK